MSKLISDAERKAKEEKRKREMISSQGQRLWSTLPRQKRES